MLKSSLCDFSDEYIRVSRNITITGDSDDDAAKRADVREKRVRFKNCRPFADCISQINNNQIDNAKDIDVVMPMYKLIEQSNIY